MDTNKTHKLVLYNDDHNGYLYVIACLIRFCKHEPVQAEQCAIIAHSVGKCSVKSGDYLQMLELKSDFEELKLNTEIETYESYLH
jgi:ATP-dependent Clp protease adaptor protein ClpS